ncbi:hypothetical protein ACFSGX_15295 [Sphingomonas arantia]|uniref:Uncharacterized protein n=1 Tax=Sphingomonas arantia TaxID=1460676 RepID=A0ABW4U042_9SPHN
MQASTTVAGSAWSGHSCGLGEFPTQFAFVLLDLHAVWRGVAQEGRLDFGRMAQTRRGKTWFVKRDGISRVPTLALDHIADHGIGLEGFG